MTAERLQKVMAAAGVGSRRTCETLITEGRVQVNGKVVTELGAKADPRRDRIVVDGKPLKLQADHVYYKVHKPRGMISDIGGDEIDLRTGELRKTVADLLPADHARVFPVGRLDLHSEGLVLLTDDGELANRLTHPRYQHPKTYYVLLGEKPPFEAMEKLRKGVDLPEGRTAPADVVITDRLPTELRLSKGPSEGVWLRVVLREGKKRQIRHMTAAVGYPTLRLVRWAIGPLTLGRLELNEAEPLTADEINALRKLAGLPATARPAPANAGSTRTAPGRAGGAGRASGAGKTSGARPRKSLPPTGQRARVDEGRPGRRPATRPGLRVTARKYSADSNQRGSGQDEDTGSSARPGGDQRVTSGRKPYAGRPGGARPYGSRPAGSRPPGNRPPSNRTGGRPGAPGGGEAQAGDSVAGEAGAGSRPPRGSSQASGQGGRAAGERAAGERAAGGRPGSSQGRPGSQRTGGRPAGRPGDKPGDKPGGKSGGPPSDRPGARPPGKYNVKVTKRPAKPSGKPGGKPTGKSSGQPKKGSAGD